jgi:PTH1 family peptidyl-tRNA hydrolase
MHPTLIGLGNPDAKYAKNRHNVGFMFVDWLAKELKATWKYNKYARAELAKTDYLLVKPQTYMNNSGESVKKIMSNLQLPASSIFIVHDDLDMRLGNFKVQMGVGPKKHNGVDSIEHHLKTSEFWRIRIGVDNRIQGTGMQGEAYVLSNFSNEELEQVTAIFPKILEKLQAVLK